MKDLTSLKIYYPHIVNRVVGWLQGYFQTSESNIEQLLSNDGIHTMKVADLNELFDAVITDEDVIKLNFFSLQPNGDEVRMYYVELLTEENVVMNRIRVPIYSKRSFEDTSIDEIEKFFKTFLYEVLNMHYHSYGVGEDEFSEKSRLDQNEEEMDVMEDFNKLIFKSSFGASNTPKEENAEVNEFGLEDEMEVVISSDIPYVSISDEIVSEELFFEDNVYSEDTAVLEGVSENTVDMLFDSEEIYVKEKGIDFTALNQELVDLYRMADKDTRQTLKKVKAEFWEFELKQADDEISSTDVQLLVQNILAIEVDAPKVLKWQVTAARRLLEEVK